MKNSSDALPHRTTARNARLTALALAAAAVALPAQALYKVVGPDGKVTYTDRPPSVGEGKVTPLTSTGAAAPVNASELPLELRQVVVRYPVTLYVVADCSPCDSARSLLRQRGIPFAERVVATEEDTEAVMRLLGTRDVPSLTIGAQVLRGFSAETWSAYLDTAGYPRESRLPPGYQYAAAAPLVQRAEAARPAPPASAPAAPARPAPPPAATQASPSGIRF
jgi:glutaredoxin